MTKIHRQNKSGKSKWQSANDKENMTNINRHKECDPDKMTHPETITKRKGQINKQKERHQEKVAEKMTKDLYLPHHKYVSEVE